MSIDHKDLNENGYLNPRRAWNEALAAQLAQLLGIGPLSDRHLAVLEVLRRHHDQSRAIPPATHVCHEAGLEASCIDELFGGPANAWKSAGLPDPGEEARIYLENQTHDR